MTLFFFSLNVYLRFFFLSSILNSPNRLCEKKRQKDTQSYLIYLWHICPENCNNLEVESTLRVEKGRLELKSCTIYITIFCFICYPHSAGKHSSSSRSTRLFFKRVQQILGFIVTRKTLKLNLLFVSAHLQIYSRARLNHRTQSEIS